MVELMITCPFCGKAHSVVVAEAEYEAYCNGALAQKAFPFLSATEREQIISGICPECQDSIFGQNFGSPWPAHFMAPRAVFSSRWQIYQILQAIFVKNDEKYFSHFYCILQQQMV